MIQIVRVSGTIKKAEQEAIWRARLSIQRAQHAARKAAVSSSIVGQSGGPTEEDFEVVDDDMGFENGIEDVEGDDGDEEDDDS